MAESAWPAVILAAGASTRLGRPKQLIRIHGESLIRRAVRAANEAGFAPVYVVLGANAADLLAEVAELGVVPVENPAWPEGMASSLRAGVQMVMRAGPPHLLLMVCDQPAVCASLLSAMRAQHQAAGAAITAAEYSGRLGVPAIFAQPLYPELIQITGDRGARDVIARHSTQVCRVPFASGAWDIDTPEDLDASRFF
jgi:molybdenum cofactor cytidylyltransferase